MTSTEQNPTKALGYYDIRQMPQHRLKARLSMIDDGNAGTGREVFAEADAIRRELAHRAGCVC